jgi:CRISPR/Cas system-associated exonuclease Cas4 (RecB family)
VPEILGAVLSPTQVRAFLDCSAKWWFKYGLGLAETKTSSFAFGLAIHRTLEINFREKLETGEDLETPGMVTVFRDAWFEQIGDTVFRKDEDPKALCRTGERLVTRYMEEVAPRIQPMAVELEVRGDIAGVKVGGRVDVLDVKGRIIEVKTSSRKPSGIGPDYAFQLATYRQITPDASGEARLDTLVKTQTPQLVEQIYQVGEEDLRQTQVLFPLVQEGIRNGLYFPNRQSLFCSRRHCSFWQQCQQEFGGSIKET